MIDTDKLKMKSDMNTKQYYKNISERIMHVMTLKGISQARLNELCTENGFYISQSTLSKVLRSSASISLINVVQICKALKVDVSDILSLDENITTKIENDIAKKTTSYSPLIYRADSPAFRGYLGKYHCYFYSTISSEDNILHGRLEFEPSMSGEHCSATMRLETKKVDEHGKPIIKEYHGELIISLTMATAYCILTNEDIGEICFFQFHFIQINYEKLECRLAMVVTTCAGDNRRPTAHRMLISRKKLSKDLLYYISGQFLFNGSDITIPEENLEELRRDEKFPETFKSNLDRLIESSRTVDFRRIEELTVRAMYMSPEDKIKSICLLRKYTSAKKYNKIGTKSDEFVYQLIKKYEEEKEECGEGGKGEDAGGGQVSDDNRPV